jgi:uncharacterized protein (DUF1800 family)
MGDETTPLTEAQARHLLRRTGFGAPPDDVARLTNTPRGNVVDDEILNFSPLGFRPNARAGEYVLSHNKWIKYMVQTRHPLQEKLVLFWHDHFATNHDVVQNVNFMATQNQLLRRNCLGRFDDLVKAINKDTAMMSFLDTNDNLKAQPNENYARELQELFTLGVRDFAGNATYTQQDIAQIARAFTGWTFNSDTGAVSFNVDEHDYTSDFPLRPPKEIYATTGQFGSAQSFASPEGDTEIDQVIDIIFRHRDTKSRRTVARRITRRLLEYFAHPIPDPITSADIAAIDALIANANFATDLHPDQWSIRALLRAIFVHDAFYLTADAPVSVKWPVDYVVSTLRLLGMRLKGRDQSLGGHRRIFGYLKSMGQEVLNPPSVFGWDWETSWISSAALLSRYDFASDVSTARDGAGATAFRPDRLRPIGDLIAAGETDPGAYVDAVTEILGVQDQFPPPPATSSERDALVAYVGAVNLSDDRFVDKKLRGLFALVMQSPAYQVH